MYIFEQGEHVISAAFEIRNYGNQPDIYDSDMYNYYRTNNRHDKKNIYYGSEEMTIPEGYELIKVENVVVREQIITVFTMANTTKVAIDENDDLRLPGKPLDTMSRKLKNLNLDN